MAWSTRQLARLAGTTEKAVRYYHGIGLLSEPDRDPNGYKRYEVAHLIRLIQIVRLVDLCVPLSQIPAADDVDDPEASVRALDAELASGIERMQRIRSELAAILHHRVPWDVPQGFAEVVKPLSAADRGVITVVSGMLDADVLGDIKQLVAERDPTDDELDAIPDDASDADIERLAQRMAPVIRDYWRRFPAVADAAAHACVPAPVAQEAIDTAFAQLYRPVQLRVLLLANEILQSPRSRD
ncbi:MerR family transcriptional regulator [Sphaerisporangium sp. NPDC051011]|uniref:MerR family transcriptional regulator n=1 Tax=Sphaerisporangium sp. NPDC051011 TaxID=3155792 RepID=UPI0034094CE3